MHMVSNLKSNFALDLDYQNRFAPVVHSPYNICSTVGWAIASIYDLGGMECA